MNLISAFINEVVKHITSIDGNSISIDVPDDATDLYIKNLGSRELSKQGHRNYSSYELEVVGEDSSQEIVRLPYDVADDLDVKFRNIVADIHQNAFANDILEDVIYQFLWMWNRALHSNKEWFDEGPADSDSMNEWDPRYRKIDILADDITDVGYNFSLGIISKQYLIDLIRQARNILRNGII